MRWELYNNEDTLDEGPAGACSPGPLYYKLCDGRGRGYLVLAAGGSPIMAQGRREVEDVTSICHSLVLNMGTLEKRTVKAMLLAGKKAKELGHPVILDPVGVTASAYRRSSAIRVLEGVEPDVIRGNASEICALEKAMRGKEP